MDKNKVLRRVEILKAEGIEFRTGVSLGKDITLDQLKADFDATVLACGATKARDVEIPGRDLKGIHFADPFLKGQTQFALGDHQNPPISASGKNVIVIGGGDTGSDCVGTSNRHGAKSVTQFEILSKPPSVGKFPRAWERPEQSPWPSYTYMMRTSTSQEDTESSSSFTKSTPASITSTSKNTASSPK